MSTTSLDMWQMAAACRSKLMYIGMMMLMVSTVANAADQRFCGRQLVVTLSMICDEFPDLHYGGKRGMVDFDNTGFDSDWMSSIMMNQDPDTAAMAMSPQTDIMDPSHGHIDVTGNAQKTPLWMAMMYPQGYAFRTAAARNDLIPARFRKSPRGIVDECCLQPCSMKQLMKYCKTPA